MKIKFEKPLAQQKAVRLYKEDAQLVEKIALDEGIEQTGVIRDLVRAALEEYRKCNQIVNN